MNQSEQMLFACAKIVKFALSQHLSALEKKVVAKMLVEGFRKSHDKAESAFGKGKFLGHTLWSEKALLKLSEIGQVNKELTDNLRHEHAVPLIYLTEKILLTLTPSSSVEEIYKVIDQFSQIVIILRDEDGKLSSRSDMPANWDGKDIFARYREDDGSLKFKIINRLDSKEIS